MCFRCRFLFFVRSLEPIFLVFVYVFCFGTLRGVLMVSLIESSFFPIAIGTSKSNNGDYLWLSNADQPAVGYLGYATKSLSAQMLNPIGHQQSFP